MLGMCKKASMQHTNECQFYVTTTPILPYLDSRNFVAFGRVVEGLRVFKLVNKLETAPNERPLIEVKIANSGKFKVGKKGRLHALHSAEAKEDEKKKEKGKDSDSEKEDKKKD